MNVKFIRFDYHYQTKKLSSKEKLFHSKDAPEGINAITRFSNSSLSHSLRWKMKNNGLYYRKIKIIGANWDKTIFGSYKMIFRGLLLLI